MRNHQTSSITPLARLLATENITVQHQPVPTAAFDTKSRTLILPVWKDMPDFLYDMLVGHEVGHALFTPASYEAVKDAVRKVAPKDANTAKTYLNIVEDVRIERKMKEKFPGLRRDFVKGYADLFGREFFGENLENEITTLSLADRVNIHFKLGIMGHLNVQFNADEQVLVDEMAVADTWDEVVDLAARMYAYAAEHDPQPQPEEMPEMPEGMGMPQQGGDDDEDGEGQQEQQFAKLPDDVDDWDKEDESAGAGDDEDGDESSDSADSTDGDGEEDGEDSEDSGASMEDDTDDGESAESTEGETSTAGTEEGDAVDSEPKARSASTQDRADRMMEDLADTGAYARTYVTLPDKINEDKIVVDFNELDKMCETILGAQSPEMIENWKTFQKENRPTVQTMVKQFEMKMAADTYRRTQPAKTGRLDMNKLHNYKLTEDIFLRGASVTEGKNHGLVMLIDWSGSMSGYMEQTIHQLLNLAMFARAINVPFEVYAFTTRTRKGGDCWSNDPTEAQEYAEYKQGDVVLNGFELHNWLSSRMKSTDFNKAAANMLEVASCMSTYSRGLKNLDLGGTPLNEALVCMNNIIPAFQRKNGVQITNLVVLTDGESTGHPCRHHYTGMKTNSEGEEVVAYDYNEGVTVIQRGSKQIEVEGYNRETNSLLEILRQDHGTQVIGMYLASKKDIARTIRWNVNDWDEQQAVVAKFKKENFAILTKVGYDEFYMLPADQAVVNDALEALPEDATPTKIRNAFIKGAKAKKSSRTVLSRFAERVAKGLQH